MAAIDLTDINKTIKDGAYVAIGLGVLGFQRAQVRRRELLEALESQRKQVADSFGSVGSFTSLAEQRKQVAGRLEAQRKLVADLLDAQRKQAEVARGQFRDLLKTVDDRLAPARRQIESRVDDLQERLPGPARTAFQSFRTAVTAPETALRNAVGLS